MDRLLVLVRHRQSEWNAKNLFTTPETVLAMELATGIPLMHRLNADATVAEKQVLDARAG